MRALEHLWAGALAEIGHKQVPGEPILAMSIDYDWQALRHPGQIGYLMLGEATGLVGDECHHIGQFA